MSAVQRCENDDLARGINPAGLNLMIHHPILSGLGQFLIDILSFGKETYALIFRKIFKHFEKNGQRCQGPGRDHINSVWHMQMRVLDAAIMDLSGQIRGANNVPQKRRLAMIGFDAMNNRLPLAFEHGGEHQSRKARARPEIKNEFGMRRTKIQQLGAIGNMPCPDFFERRGTNKIFDLLPSDQQINMALKAVLCFT